MTDSTQVIHAALRTLEEDQRLKKIPAKKKEKKPDPKFNDMWNNLAYMDEQTSKIDKTAKEFVGDFVLPQEEIDKQEEERKIQKIK